MVELHSDRCRVRVSTAGLKQGAQRALETLGLGSRVLSVLLTDDRRMARLHERWMGEEGPTDVMSFEGDGPGRDTLRSRVSRNWTVPHLPATGPPPVLGDVVISVETAARRRPRAVRAEVQRYLIHGILHLAGYDHRTRPQRERMNRLARTLVKSAR